MSTLEEKIQELKNFVSNFETEELLKHVAFTLTRLAERETSETFQNLQSPHMQLFYLVALNIESDKTPDKPIPSKEEWDHMTKLLQSIEFEYIKILGFNDETKNISDEEKQKIAVALPTFIGYFFNGTLSYNEQILDRFERLFEKHDDLIIENFGLSIKDFIEIHDFLDVEHNERLNYFLKSFTDDKWQEFTSSMNKMELHDPRDWIHHLPDQFRDAMMFYSNPGKIFELNTINTINDVDRVKLNKFLACLSCEKSPSTKTLYYCSSNILLNKPIYRIDNENYIIFHINQILTSIFSMLSTFLIQKIGDKFYKERDKYLESKVAEIFTDFFGPKKKLLFDNYEVIQEHEQDLIILFEDTALIIEIKAGNIREPFRDITKAYKRIESDFNKTIQYGYEQCLRVENLFNSDIPFNLHLKNGNKQLINPIQYKNVYSIIVTLDRFGLVQSDLSYLLKIGENNPFPWAVNIDDLESFLLLLSKRKKNKLKDFKSFLKNRELLHERVICTDELDICCFFYSKPIAFIQQCHQFDTTIALHGDFTNVLERVYFGSGGLGFKNERHLALKNDPNVEFTSMPK